MCVCVCAAKSGEKEESGAWEHRILLLLIALLGMRAVKKGHGRIDGGTKTTLGLTGMCCAQRTMDQGDVTQEVVLTPNPEM